MALPVIPIAIAMGVSALWGAYKGGKAVLDNNDANDLSEKAQNIVSHYTEELDKSRDICEAILAELGRAKYDALTMNIDNFIKIFSQIKNVQFVPDDTLENLKISEFSYDMIQEMKHEISLLTTSSLAIAGGAATGAMTAFGAYSGTMALASASTGTAISTLSGAAATNATLAWLGGGTLASGGFGMAGGALMLNAIVAGPALAVAGWYMGNKAEAKLNDAKSNHEIALTFKADAEKSITLTDGISAIAVKLNDVLSKLRKFSRRNTKKLENLVENSGIDYLQYSESEKEIVFKTLKSIQLLKAIIDTPILNENGELLNDVEANINNIERAALEIS
ncbi:hypothetical protein ACFGZ0_08105 [Pasteurella multocida]|uniref:hypothetical protein n=1 Tax=Pasteurella multocida TaxID=747 RepID=UPI001F53747A|nr:hypothetical protein [Pasteurella multocida]HDR1062626.1 hypothetical protein [Pasteurella multocida]HDR1806016.1 hypothetical protein [Pasteurella multocida]HDR1868838.1 hypothetical protein [Pasteurella multocida]